MNGQSQSEDETAPVELLVCFMSLSEEHGHLVESNLRFACPQELTTSAGSSAAPGPRILCSKLRAPRAAPFPLNTNGIEPT